MVSSCDPDELSRYVELCSGMLDELAIKADAAAEALEDLRSAWVSDWDDWFTKPGEDLVDEILGIEPDLRHMDEFAQQVADAFYALHGIDPGTATPEPLTLDDDVLADYAPIGRASLEEERKSPVEVLVDHFDEIAGDDGIVTADDLQELVDTRECTEAVYDAARLLLADPDLVNYLDKIKTGYPGDGRISQEDLDLYLELVEQMPVLEEHFDELDIARHPSQDPDGVVSLNDIEAAADGEGELAEAARFLRDNPSIRQAISEYTNNPEVTGHEGEGWFTDDALIWATVDMSVYAHDPEEAAGFVQRNHDLLLSDPPPGIDDDYTGPVDLSSYKLADLFDTAFDAPDPAVTDQLMHDIIQRVADEGELHVPELAPTLGAATRDHFELIVAGASDSHPNLSEEETGAFLAAIMVDDAATQSVYGGLLDHAANQLDPANAATIHMGRLGDTFETILSADEAAVRDPSAERIATRQQVVDGLTTIASIVAGKVPDRLPEGTPGAAYIPDAASVAEKLGAAITGNWGMNGMDEALNRDLEEIDDMKSEIDIEFKRLVTVYDYHVNRPYTPDEVLDLIATDDSGQPTPGLEDYSREEFNFFSPDGSIISYDDMTEAQRAGFTVWVGEATGSGYYGPEDGPDFPGKNSRAEEIYDKFISRLGVA